MRVESGVELPPIRGRGRPKGSGVNLDLLNSLKPGDTVWDVGLKKMRSISASAHEAGIRLMIRRIPGTRKYAFKIIQDDAC